MDMTRGRVTPLLVRFAVPLMMSSILQQMYALCDSMVVGRLIGLEAFAAVGASSFLSWLPMDMLLGLTQGFGVVLSQRFGAGDQKGLSMAYRLSMLIGVLIALVLSILGLLFLNPLLAIMRTPVEMVYYSERYLRVIFSGLILTALYNASATMLRARGDSRTPFVALVVSTIINIALDYILIAWAGMGVEGVALATILAQAASLTVCIVQISRAKVIYPMLTEAFSRKRVYHELLKQGLPPMFRNSMTSVGGVFVQSVVNGFGTEFVAGMTAARRYFSMMEMVCCGLEGAVATFVGQNTGAGNLKRAREGTSKAVRLGVIAAVLTGSATAAFAKPLISLLIAQSNPAALQSGVIALRIASVLLPALYLLCLYRASVQSMGDSIMPVMCGFTEMAMRLICVLILPPFIGRYAAYIADGAGWIGGAALMMTTYYHRKKHSK